jgi:hypothetical protein
MLKHGNTESMHETQSNAEGYKKSLMPEADGPTRIYIIDADEEDRRKCENCKQYQGDEDFKWCEKGVHIVFDNPPPPDFNCKFFEDKEESK